MIAYEYDNGTFDITESKNGADSEFRIRVKADASRHTESLHKIRADFEHNDVLTDVLFYTHQNNEYQVIVRQDFVEEFIVSLFRYRIVTQVRWK